MSIPVTPVRLSVIVIGYKMARQLANTLYTLSPAYQRNITENDYEVIVVENESSDNIPAPEVESLGKNFRYFRRQESGVSPVPALNFGFAQCRGSTIGLIVDGARMVTPGALYRALQASQLGDNIITAAPGYHLGEQEQQYNKTNQYTEETEQALMATIDWRQEGYELFRIATFSGANQKGYLQPMMECNCLFAPHDSFRRIGYADEDFTLRGGGSINLHMYRSLGMLADSQLVVLPGEGSFHQYHGGVTTSEYDGLDAELASHKKQLHAKWGGVFHSLRRNPTLLGSIPQQAQHFLTLSTHYAEKRLKRLSNAKQPLWPDDDTL